MSECLWAVGSGRVEEKMVPSLPLLSYESSVSVNKNPGTKKSIIKEPASQDETTAL